MKVLNLQKTASGGGRAAMMPAFYSRAVQNDARRRVLVHDLALENSPVLDGQMKHVSLSGIWHRIKSYDRSRTGVLHPVPHAPQVSVATVQAPDTSKRRALRQLLHSHQERCKECSPEIFSSRPVS